MDDVPGIITDKEPARIYGLFEKGIYLCSMNKLLKERYLLLLILVSAVVAVLMHFPEIISLVDNDPVDIFPGMSVVDVVSEVVMGFVSLLLLFLINLYWFGFHRPIAAVGWKNILSAFIVIWCVSSLLWRVFVGIHSWGLVPAVEAMTHYYLHPLRDVMITLIVVGTSYILYLIRRSRRIQTENQQLQEENLIHKYEALKNQLNPHMLFNSLNTLQSLIPDAPVKAQDYVQELSRVLRYTLQENQNKNVTLREEMEFVRSFIFLLKMRYEDNLIFDVEIDAACEDRVIPPMSVQMLIENAVKHNEISNRKPLTVTVTTQDGELSVSNLIQPRRTPYIGMGIGLSNLSKRYQLLFRKEISVRKDKDMFTVTIPLI